MANIFEDAAELLGGVAKGGAPLLGYGAASMLGIPYAAPLFSSAIGGLGGVLSAKADRDAREEMDKKAKDELNQWRRYSWTSKGAAENAPKYEPITTSRVSDIEAGLLSGLKSGLPKDESISGIFQKAMDAKQAEEDKYWENLMNQTAPVGSASLPFTEEQMLANERYDIPAEYLQSRSPASDSLAARQEGAAGNRLNSGAYRRRGYSPLRRGGF